MGISKQPDFPIQSKIILLCIFNPQQKDFLAPFFQDFSQSSTDISSTVDNILINLQNSQHVPKYPNLFPGIPTLNSANFSAHYAKKICNFIIDFGRVRLERSFLERGGDCMAVGAINSGTGHNQALKRNTGCYVIGGISGGVYPFTVG